MNILQNKIDAASKTIKELLKEQKFYIDYFQREYRWKEKHIRSLVDDLITTFEKSYDQAHGSEAVENYQNYYLGPVVFSVTENGKKSIIDGQQRITSITLLLIYLHHLQVEHVHAEDNRVSVLDLIYSKRLRKTSFNMTDEAREPCLHSLLTHGTYDAKEEDDETVINMAERYDDIAKFFDFPEDRLPLEKALPFFVDWLIEKVVFVEITAYSDENAYVIFETMNDRGLNLTSTEMLKGYVLSKISDSNKRIEINEIWKEQIQKLHAYGETADQSFFQAWFRGKYAQRMRQSKAGSKDDDFELIGSRFHSWFKSNHKTLFKLKGSDDFYNFFKVRFPFYVKCFSRIRDAQAKCDKSIPHLHYVESWGIAESLQDPLLLAPIKFDDGKETIQKKLDCVARYIETFTVRRSVNLKRFGHASIKHTMFNVVKKIRGQTLGDLATTLSAQIEDIEQKWDAVSTFCWGSRNRRFVKHLLSRISGYLDELAGKNSNYADYHHPSAGKRFEIEHLLGAKFDAYKDDAEYRGEFENKDDFEGSRNAIGALVLLPNGVNQSFGSDKYEDKLEHYLKENTYAQALHEKFYQKNPNFLHPEKIRKLGFKHHLHFKKKDIEERNELVKRICEELWSTEYFRLKG